MLRNFEHLSSLVLCRLVNAGIYALCVLLIASIYMLWFSLVTGRRVGWKGCLVLLSGNKCFWGTSFVYQLVYNDNDNTERALSRVKGILRQTLWQI